MKGSLPVKKESRSMIQECAKCGGRGVLIGPYDPKTRKRETSPCDPCDGYGVRVLREEQVVTRPDAAAGRWK